MRIAIVGATAEGKTRFIRRVLIPALLAHPEYTFKVYEHGVLTESNVTESPRLIIGAFTSPEAACTWLKIRRP